MRHSDWPGNGEKLLHNVRTHGPSLFRLGQITLAPVVYSLVRSQKSEVAS